jgi:hypothetical protein
VWGSEFTIKVAPKGGSVEFPPRLNVNFWFLPACLPGSCYVLLKLPSSLVDRSTEYLGGAAGIDLGTYRRRGATASASKSPKAHRREG